MAARRTAPDFVMAQNGGELVLDRIRRPSSRAANPTFSMNQRRLRRRERKRDRERRSSGRSSERRKGEWSTAASTASPKKAGRGEPNTRDKCERSSTTRTASRTGFICSLVRMFACS